MPEEKPFKLNLWAIVWKESEKKQNSSENKISNNISPEEKDNVENKKIDLYNMLGIKKEKEYKEKETKKRQEKEVEEEIKKKEPSKEKEVFVNYKSDFNSEETTILESIKNFKEYVKPKTRIGFIIIVISTTLLWIISLFIIAPKIHNISNYKNKIISAKETFICKIDTKKCIKNKAEIKVVKNEIKKEVLTKKTFIKWNFKVNYEVKNIDWKEIIIYKEIEYDNIENLIKIIEIERRHERINKLKKHIKNKDK